MNKLRNRIALQVDGGLKTGRDVVIGALLGADEFGFSTAPLVSVGCIMMRKCHLNTCPVGVATQNEALRKKFKGTPENVINYFFMVAEEVREIMAKLGIKNFQDLIGKSELLEKNKAINHWKAKDIDLSKILYKPHNKEPKEIYNSSSQNHSLDFILDKEVINEVTPVLEKQISTIDIYKSIKNTDRSFGAMLSGKLARKFGHKGLREDSIVVNLEGTAGQSFGTFLSSGVTISLSGEANDYVGKGLSGGKIIIKPFRNSQYESDKNIIVGNTVLYGAISGECYFSGVAGERFGVRNSGAIAVVEGTGDHCCEYMTGGVVMVIGNTGVNFAAGMSGGISYVYQNADTFKKKCNLTMVNISKVKKTKHILPEKLFDKYNFLFNDDLRIKEMLKRHYNSTGSIIAKRILENFDEELKNFVKILPMDFENVLSKRIENEKDLKVVNLWQK